MADTLESLEIEVKHKASGAETEIAKVTAQIEAMSKALASALPQLKQYTAELAKISGKVKANAQSAAPKAPPTPVPDDLRELISGASSIDVLEAKLVSLRAAMEQAFDAGDTDKAYGLRNQILQTEAALERAKKAANDAAGGIKNLSKQASKSKGPLGTLVASLERIAFYRIIRSILKAVGQAFQEGLEKAYLFSAGMTGAGHRFAVAMDNIKSSGNAMKAQLGSAFIALFAAVEPILIAIINLVTKAADALSQLLAAFTGKTYLRAQATAAQFSDAMQRGASAAKEWKNQLLGFDEINRLEEPSNGGGGGGTNPLAGYELVDTPINDKLLAFVDNLKNRLQPAIDGCKEAFARLKEAWGRFVESISQDGALGNLISDLLVLCGNVVLDGITALADALSLLLDVLTALNTGDWTNVWRGFAQLLYDIVVLLMDAWVGLANLIMDALIAVAKAIDRVTGTHLADYLIEDQQAFNEMYNSAKKSDEGLFGLKKTLGLVSEETEGVKTATESTTSAAEEFTDSLASTAAQATVTKQKVSGIRSAVDFVLSGFEFFGTEVASIFTSLLQPIADFCAWIDSAIQGWSIFNGIQRFNDPNYDVYSDPDAWLQGFASGGFPSEGQLFIANESGPEMVGTIGGRTAVAPSSDIVESVRQGVYDAVSAAMSNGGNGDVSLKVYLDSREIRAGLQRLDRAWGA